MAAPQAARQPHQVIVFYYRINISYISTDHWRLPNPIMPLGFGNAVTAATLAMEAHMIDHLHRAKEKKMAYVLHHEFGYTKSSIANLMKISPQQMGQWIKEVHYEVQIHRLHQELDSIKKELISHGYQPQKALDRNDFNF